MRPRCQIDRRRSARTSVCQGFRLIPGGPPGRVEEERSVHAFSPVREGYAMATAQTAPPTPSGKPLLPPAERFWRRYSPHYEFPLASATSVFFHSMVIGILAIGGLAFLFQAGPEAAPPKL